MPTWLLRLLRRIGETVLGERLGERPVVFPEHLDTRPVEPPSPVGQKPVTTNPWRERANARADERERIGGLHDPYKRKKTEVPAPKEYILVISGRGASRTKFNGDPLEKALRGAFTFSDQRRDFLRELGAALNRARENDKAKTKAGAKVHFEGGIARVTRTPKK